MVSYVLGHQKEKYCREELPCRMSVYVIFVFTEAFVVELIYVHFVGGVSSIFIDRSL